MPKILVVDDDPDFIELVRLMLEPNGYDVANAANSSEGLSKLAEDQPDLVILDVIMSTVLDGLSMTRQMQQVPEYSRIPIIMVTSIANTDYAALFPTDEYVKIDSFMTKPISSDKLLEKIGRLID